MDLATLIAAMTGTGIVSVGAAHWLTKRIIDHRLAKEMKDYEDSINKGFATYKADLDHQIADAKSALDARLRLEVEEALGEKAAERQYRVEAKKRLYSAVGPLRFQLLLASNEFSNRIARLSDTNYTFDTAMRGYFGRSTAYRLLRVYAILELIERQIAYADFAVDEFYSCLLRFKGLAFSCLTSDRISLDHPENDWNNQSQHIFYDSLSAIASQLIQSDSQTVQRVMRFDEFSEYMANDENLKRLSPLPRLLSNFSPNAKPILWLRLVALSILCQAFVRWQGKALRFESANLNANELLRVSEDSFIETNEARYSKILNELNDTFVQEG